MQYRERVKREREWHNLRFDSDSRSKKTGIFYTALGSWYRDYDHFCLSRRNTNILELGAGLETILYDISDCSLGISIDISELAIEKIRSKNTRSNLQYYVMDAHELEFSDNQFDMVIARGVLHHLDLDFALSEIKRVLKDGGQVVFGEPLNGNLFIRLYRYCTPHLRTPDEKPLSNNDIKFVLKYFDKSTIRYYGFLTILCSIIRLNSFQGLCEYLDNLVLNKLRLGRYLAWTCIIRS